MKRIVLIALALLAFPVVTLQQSGVNLLSEASDLSYAFVRSFIVEKASGKYTERGLISYGARRNDHESHYYRVKKYTVENGVIIPYLSSQPLVDENVELVNETPEFEESQELVPEPEEFIYEDEGLGAVPEIGEIDLKDLEEDKKKDAVPGSVEFGGFNL